MSIAAKYRRLHKLQSLLCGRSNRLAAIYPGQVEMLIHNLEFLLDATVSRRSGLSRNTKRASSSTSPSRHQSDERRPAGTERVCESLGEEVRRAEAEIERLRAARRRALAIADQRAKENVELRREIERLWAVLDGR
jgi:uncharacterized membrane protein YccC